MDDTPVSQLRFDFSGYGAQAEPLCFQHPLKIVSTTSLSQVTVALNEVQRYVDEGFYAAGYVSYEAAPAFDPAMPVRTGTVLPLLWFGIFSEPEKGQARKAMRPYRVTSWTPDTPREKYDRNIGLIKEAIARGDTYQVNYTIRLAAQMDGDDYTYYEALRSRQNGGYSAYLNLGRYRILSLSPELFFRRNGAVLEARPMKGTIRRGATPAEDEHNRETLRTSEKDRAENVMIVDLLRNDLGRLADNGSVSVPELFNIEPYPTVYQMTSTVKATCSAPSTLEELFRALFPCGSVTGAPKLSTMKLIRQLEATPREVYCGAIGYVEPGGNCTFSVPIRTVWLDTKTHRAHYGVGGGVVWDSTAAGEYDELLAKARLVSML